MATEPNARSTTETSRYDLQLHQQAHLTITFLRTERKLRNASTTRQRSYGTLALHGSALKEKRLPMGRVQDPDIGAAIADHEAAQSGKFIPRIF
jgi:hypothetical protein